MSERRKYKARTFDKLNTTMLPDGKKKYMKRNIYVNLYLLLLLFPILTLSPLCSTYTVCYLPSWVQEIK